MRTEKHDVTVPEKYGIKSIDKRYFKLSILQFWNVHFKRALVIKHYVRLAFLFVQTVHVCTVKPALSGLSKIDKNKGLNNKW